MGFSQLLIGRYLKTRILRMAPSPLSWNPCKRRVRSTHCMEEAWLSSYLGARIMSCKQLSSSSDTTRALALAATNIATDQRVDRQVPLSPKAPWHAQRASPRRAATSRKPSRSQESRKNSSLASIRPVSSGDLSRISRFLIIHTFQKRKACGQWRSIRTSITILRCKLAVALRRSTVLTKPTVFDTRPSRALDRFQCLRFVTSIMQPN